MQRRIAIPSRSIIRHLPVPPAHFRSPVLAFHPVSFSVSLCFHLSPYPVSLAPHPSIFPLTLSVTPSIPPPFHHPSSPHLSRSQLLSRSLSNISSLPTPCPAPHRTPVPSQASPHSSVLSLFIPPCGRSWKSYQTLNILNPHFCSALPPKPEQGNWSPFAAPSTGLRSRLFTSQIVRIINICDPFSIYSMVRLTF